MRQVSKPHPPTTPPSHPESSTSTASDTAPVSCQTTGGRHDKSYSVPETLPDTPLPARCSTSCPDETQPGLDAFHWPTPYTADRPSAATVAGFACSCTASWPCLRYAGRPRSTIPESSCALPPAPRNNGGSTG